MIMRLAYQQNWAKAAPWLGILTAFLLLLKIPMSNPLFWGLVNIPLYLFHQTEEHYIPGGFKDYMNQVVNQLPPGQEVLTDRKVFFINILLVWIAFLLFGLLSFLNLGFGLLIIIFSLINCTTHIVEWFRRRRWNPGLIMASLQFLLSLYAAYFITFHGLSNAVFWWITTLLFSILVHALLFRLVLSKTSRS